MMFQEDCINYDS